MWEKTTKARIASAFIVMTMLLAVTFAIRQLPSIRLQNNLETWLAEDDEQARALERMEYYFPKEERVVVSWDSSSIDDERCAEFRDRVALSSYISKARTAAELLQQLKDWKVPDDDAVGRLTGLLIGPQPAGAEKLPAVSTVLTLSDAGVQDPGAAIADVKAAAAASSIDEDELHVDGSLVTSLAVDREVMTSTWNTVDPLQRPPVFAISALAGILLAFFVLRSVQVGLMVTSIAWSTALVTTSLIPAAGHTMNMVTIVMPTLIMVLTVSAAIHVVNYWKHAAAEGTKNPVRASVRMGFRPCLLATATTGVGLLSLIISRLGPIREFGTFSTIGTLLSFVAVMTCLPALLHLSGVRPGVQSKDHPIWRSVAERVCRRRRPIIATFLIVGLTTAFGLQWLKTEVKVGRYFPDDSRLIQDSRFFETNIGGTGSIDVVIHFDEEGLEKKHFIERLEFVRTVEEALRVHPHVSGAISLADFQPVIDRPGNEASRSERLQYTLRSRRTESKIKNDERASSAEYLAVSKDPDYVWSMGEPCDETWRITVQTLIGDDVDYGTVTNQIADIVRQQCQDASGLWFDVTGSIPVFFQAQKALLNSLTRSLGLAFVVIAIAMMILLRSVTAGLFCSVPGIFPIAVVFGSMSWAGQVLDIGTMLTGSVALGIAVDDMLHLVTWFRIAISQGKSRQEAVVHALRHCGAAMTQTTLVIALGLLLLFPAQLLLISRFGWVMAALLAVAWISSVLLLPALLAGALGRIIEHVEHASTKPSADDDSNTICQGAAA